MITFYLEKVSLWASRDPHLTGKKKSLICSGNSVVQPFSLGLKMSCVGSKLNKFLFPHFDLVKPHYFVSHKAYWQTLRVPKVFSQNFSQRLKVHPECAVWHPRQGSVLPPLPCGWFLSKAAIKYEWVIAISPMATSGDQLLYSWAFVPKGGCWTRNKTVNC